MKRIIQGIEYDIDGTITEDNKEEIELLIRNYDWWTVYIGNTNQRAEAENENIKNKKRLKELGIESFKRIKR